jgi:hypothetical protein
MLARGAYDHANTQFLHVLQYTFLDDGRIFFSPLVSAEVCRNKVRAADEGVEANLR